VKSICAACDKEFTAINRVSHHLRDNEDHRIIITEAKNIDRKTGLSIHSNYKKMQNRSLL
jgi:hypothetical protein